MRELLGSICLLAFAWPLQAANVSFSAPDVGEVYQYTHTAATIIATNSGDKPVKVVRIEALSAGDTASGFPVVIPPKSSIDLPVEVFSALDPGNRWHAFRIETDGPEPSAYKTRVHLFALSVLDDAMPQVDFGVVDAGHASAPRTVVLTSREVPDFKLVRIIEAPDFVEAKLGASPGSVEISTKSDASWGRHNGLVKVALNSTMQPEAWIQVGVDVHGEIVPSQNPLDVGLKRKGGDPPALVQLRSRDGKPFTVGAIRTEGIKGTVTAGACPSGAAGCVQLEFRVSDDELTGRLTGKIIVDLPQSHRQLPVDVTGLLLDKGAEVKSLNEELEKATAANRQKATQNQTRVDLAHALNHAVESKTSAPVASAPEGRGPLIRWQVANEQAIYGYAIYRADSENGQYLRVNKEIVRSTSDGSPGLVSAYQWRDTSAKSGATYWYYVGIINKDGTKVQLSGPHPTVAK